MSDRYIFEDLKDEKVLVQFLERVWKAGLRTGMITTYSSKEAIEKFMPDFNKELSK